VSYTLEWRLVAGPGATTTVTGITDPFYDLSGLTESTDYEFRVLETDGTTPSAFSAWYSFTSGTPATPSIGVASISLSMQPSTIGIGQGLDFGPASVLVTGLAGQVVSGGWTGSVGNVAKVITVVQFGSAIGGALSQGPASLVITTKAPSVSAGHAEATLKGQISIQTKGFGYATGAGLSLTPTVEAIQEVAFGIAAGGGFGFGGGSLTINPQLVEMVLGLSLGFQAQSITINTSKFGLAYFTTTPGFRTIEIPLMDVTLGVPLMDVTLGVPAIERLLTISETDRKIQIG